LVVVHFDVTNGNTQTEYLLELELDGAANLIELVVEVFVDGDGGGELASWTTVRTKH